MTAAELPEGRRGQALALGIAALAAALLWFGVASPLLALYETETEALAQRRALLSHMQAAASRLPALAARAGKPTEAAGLLQGASDAVAAAGLQEMIQRMAASAGTSLTAVETLPAEADQRWHKIALRISLNASWPVLMRLLHDVDTARVRVFTDDLHFHSPVVAVNPVAAPIQASLVVYGFREGG